MPPLHPKKTSPSTVRYPGLVGGIGKLLEAARRTSARAVNALMTATYWEIGRRIVEFEQRGAKRAEYGDALLDRLAEDLTKRFGRGFSRFNLGRFRQFYLSVPMDRIRATVSLESPGMPKRATPLLELPGSPKPSAGSAISSQQDIPLADPARVFPLPWSHYCLLIGRSRSPEAFSFYHAEALHFVTFLSRQTAHCDDVRPNLCDGVF